MKLNPGIKILLKNQILRSKKFLYLSVKIGNLPRKTFHTNLINFLKDQKRHYIVNLPEDLNAENPTSNLEKFKFKDLEN